MSPVHIHSISLRSFLILSSHLHVGPASIFLHQRLLPQLCVQFSYLLCLPLYRETRRICFHHSKECTEGYELWSSSYFIVLHSAVSSLLSPVALLCLTPSLCIQVSHQQMRVYTGCPRRNVPDFGRVFLMLKYTDITQNTKVQSWTVTEIMAREKCGLLAGPHTVPVSCQSYTFPSLSVVSYDGNSAHASYSQPCYVNAGHSHV